MPGLFKISPRNAHQYIHPYWWNPHLIKITFFGKTSFCKTGGRGTEDFESLINSNSFFRICADPQIQILCETRFGILNESITADYQVFNVVVVEKSQ